MIGYPLLLKGSPVQFSIWVELIILIIALYFFLRPLYDARAIQKRRYIITGNRAMVLTRDGEFKDMKLNKITDVMFLEKSGGTCDILIGKDAVRSRYSGIRSIALVPRENIYAEEDSKISGIVFYNVKNYKDCEKLFLPGTEISKKNI